MAYLLVGFLGVILGAGAAGGVGLLLLQRAADRDLVERRLRALLSYQESLGAPRSLLDGGDGGLEAAELEQLVHNLSNVAREFRLTSWLFDEGLRAELAGALIAFEEEARRARGRGSLPSTVRLADSCRQFQLTLRQAARKGVREFRRWQSWPFARKPPVFEGAMETSFPGVPPEGRGSGLPGANVPLS